MPISIHTDRSKHLTTFVATGDLTLRDVKEALEAFYKVENSPPTMGAVWDLGQARAERISGHELEAIAAVGSQYQGARKGGKTALVSPNDLEYGLARMVSVFTEGLSIRVQAFRSMEEAHDWLDLNALSDQGEDSTTHPAPPARIS